MLLLVRRELALSGCNCAITLTSAVSWLSSVSFVYSPRRPLVHRCELHAIDSKFSLLEEEVFHKEKWPKSLDPCCLHNWRSEEGLENENVWAKESALEKWTRSSKTTQFPTERPCSGFMTMDVVLVVLVYFSRVLSSAHIVFILESFFPCPAKELTKMQCQKSGGCHLWLGKKSEYF